jgi:hypothetical protein
MSSFSLSLLSLQARVVTVHPPCIQAEVDTTIGWHYPREGMLKEGNTNMSQPETTDATSTPTASEQRLSLGADAGKPIEPRLAQGAGTVGRPPKRLDEVLMECETEDGLHVFPREAISTAEGEVELTRRSHIISIVFLIVGVTILVAGIVISLAVGVWPFSWAQ